MKNIKLTLEFDGTDFHGWQFQPGVRTVQGVLEDALGDLFGDLVEVNGCCRTDAGVHAWEFVGNFRADTELEPDQVRRALVGGLPDDVVVKRAEEAAPDFHARYSCLARRYVYKITTARTAVFRRYLALTQYQLDVFQMADGARALIGRHDFTSFAPASLADDVSPICNVMDASLQQDGTVVSFDIKADRFLHHMVRNIVGTLIEVGRGRLEPEQVGDILRTKDRRAAGPTAPACGLALKEALYPD